MMEIIVGVCVVGCVGIVLMGIVLMRKRNQYNGEEQPAVYNPMIIDNKQMEHDIKEVYSRPVDKTSIIIDIPRLAPKVTIYNNSEMIVSCPQQVKTIEHYKSEECIKTVVSTLAQQLNEPELYNKLMDSYHTYFPYIKKNIQGDASIFCESYLKDNIEEDHLIFSILKTITQCMFASAVQFFVPLRIEFPYRDLPDGWKIDITIKNECVIITHHKRERSIMSDWFDIEWCLEIEIDRVTKKITNVDIYVQELVFGNAIDDQSKKRIEDIVNSLNISQKSK